MKLHKLPKRIRIRITKESIENGQRFDPHWCPVALALKDRLKDFEVPLEVSVGYYDAYTYSWQQDVDKDASYNYTEPDKVGEFMDRFDSGNKVRPFNVTLVQK